MVGAQQGATGQLRFFEQLTLYDRLCGLCDVSAALLFPFPTLGARFVKSCVITGEACIMELFGVELSLLAWSAAAAPM